MKRHRNIINLIACILLINIFNPEFHAYGDLIATKYYFIMPRMKNYYEKFAAAHAGANPKSYNELQGIIATSGVEYRPENRIDFKSDVIILEKDCSILVDGYVYGPEAKILAMTSFPIDQARDSGIGRYVLFQFYKSGNRSYTWISEEQIQQSLANAGIVIPSAPVRLDCNLKAADLALFKLDDVYAAWKVSPKMVGEVFRKYKMDATDRKVKYVTTWREISALYTYTNGVATLIIPSTNTTSSVTGTTNITSSIASTTNENASVVTATNKTSSVVSATNSLNTTSTPAKQSNANTAPWLYLTLFSIAATSGVLLIRARRKNRK